MVAFKCGTDFSCQSKSRAASELPVASEVADLVLSCRPRTAAFDSGTVRQARRRLESFMPRR